MIIKLQENPALICAALATLFAALFVLNSCSETPQNAGGDGAIAVNVRFPQEPSASSSQQFSSPVAALGAPTINCQNLGIGVITIEILSSGTVIGERDFSCLTGEGTITQIPSGSGYQVRVSGRPYQGGPALYQGITPNVTVTPGATRTIDVDVPVHITSLSLQPATLRLQHGQTVQLERIVTVPDDIGAVSLESLAFASSNTAVAQVSGGGVISAQSQGTANITATLGNISKVIPVTVVAGFTSGTGIPITSPANDVPTTRMMKIGDTVTFQLANSANLISTCPPDLNCVLGQSDLQVTAISTAKPGFHLITITGGGTPNPLFLPLFLGVIVLPPDGPLPGTSSGSQLRVFPLVKTVRSGGSSSAYSVELTSAGGTGGASTLSLGVTGCPSNVNCVFSPTSLLPTASGSTGFLTVTALSGALAGSYPLTIMAGGTQARVQLIVEGSKGGRFVSMPAMPTPRDGHTATLLTTGEHAGKILVVGGFNNGVPLSTVILYNPNTQKWEPGTSFSIQGGQGGLGDHSATLLADGQVLITGGRTGSPSTPTANCMKWTLASTWAGCNPMVKPRVGHSATLITSGPQKDRVLVVGGAADGTNNTAELFANVFASPATSGVFFSVPNTGVTSASTAMGLSNGNVLVVGTGGTKGELYVPLTDTGAFGTPAPTAQWNATGNSTILVSDGRAATSSVTLLDGRVLATGDPTPATSHFAWLYTPPPGNMWAFTEPPPSGRNNHSITRLLDGTVILIGGFEQSAFQGTSLFTAALYDPGPGTWQTLTHNLLSSRTRHTGTLLSDGTVLIVGGKICTTGEVQNSICQSLDSVELYIP